MKFRIKNKNVIIASFHGFSSAMEHIFCDNNFLSVACSCSTNQKASSINACWLKMLEIFWNCRNLKHINLKGGKINVLVHKGIKQDIEPFSLYSVQTNFRLLSSKKFVLKMHQKIKFDFFYSTYYLNNHSPLPIFKIPNLQHSHRTNPKKFSFKISPLINAASHAFKSLKGK